MKKSFKSVISVVPWMVVAIGFAIIMLVLLQGCSFINMNEDLGCAKVILVEPEPVPEPEPVVVEEMIVEEIPVTTTTITEMVLFDYDKSILRPGQKGVIEDIAEYITEYPDTIINLNGYASEEGKQDYNLVLSHMRCITVYDALLKMGVPAGNVRNIIPKGETTVFGGKLEPNRVVVVITKDNP